MSNTHHAAALSRGLPVRAHHPTHPLRQLVEPVQNMPPHLPSSSTWCDRERRSLPVRSRRGAAGKVMSKPAPPRPHQ